MWQFARCRLRRACAAPFLSLETSTDDRLLANNHRIVKRLAKALIDCAYAQAGLNLCWLHILHS